MSLCVVGDFAWDVLIRTNNEVLKGGDSFGEVMLTPGGSGANVAVWARRCGLDTHFVGKVGRDQVEDYARRKGMAVEDAERWLAPNLGYEPADIISSAITSPT